MEKERLKSKYLNQNANSMKNFRILPKKWKKKLQDGNI
jgi:hypothetical protein